MAQTNQTLASLKNRLQMPMVVRDMLITKIPASTETTYALHEMLSDYSAEDAMLAAAFTMQEIAVYQNVAVTDLAFLHLECDRLIERYSARDDLFQENPELWAETQNEMISEIAEDLEGFLDLLSLCMLSFEVTAPKIYEILTIFDTQLQAQIIIIDEVQAMLDNLETEQVAQINNIIMFPVQTQKRIMNQA